MKFYISGGIAGLNRAERRAEFRLAKSLLEMMGHTAVDPFDCVPEPHEGDCPPSYAEGEGHSAACHLRTDLLALLQCEAIQMLDGWERSRGALLEHSVAANCGLKIYYSSPTWRKE